MSGEKADLKGTLSGGGKELVSYKSGKSASIELTAKGPNAFTLSAEGKGKGYYSWNLTGTPKSQPRSEHKGLNVECAWFDEKGNAVDMTRPIPQGTRLTVTLTLKPSAAVSNVALSYLLPAGLELDNPRLDDTAEVTPGSYGIVNDVRDDRLLLFFDRVDGEVSYGFKARAVTRGTFAVPPVSAVGMYDPSVRFIGRSQQELVIE